MACLQTFITEDNHEFEKPESFDKNVVNDELKYEDYDIKYDILL